MSLPEPFYFIMVTGKEVCRNWCGCGFNNYLIYFERGCCTPYALHVWGVEVELSS